MWTAQTPAVTLRLAGTRCRRRLTAARPARPDHPARAVSAALRPEGRVTPESPWLRGPLVVALVFIVQEALLRGLRIDGVRPDILLGAGIVAAVVGGPERGRRRRVRCSACSATCSSTRRSGCRRWSPASSPSWPGASASRSAPDTRWAVPVLTASGALTG